MTQANRDTALRVVAGVLCRGGRVLAAQRGPGQRHPGCWELPGGKVEAGESDEAALIRELEEELGVTVRAPRILGSHVHRYPDLLVELVAVEARLGDAEPNCLEHAELRWLSVDELGSVGWAPADVGLLPLVVQALGSTVQVPSRE